MTLDSPLVKEIIKLAIKEDLSGGDITSTLTIPQDHVSLAEFLAKEEMIVCGMPIVEKLISELNFALKFEILAKDGTSVKKNTTIATLRGNTRQILSLERLALNFLQHLSGIASLTGIVTAKAGKLKILDTRKTTPGLRLLEKYAVKTGGGDNHRMNLSDMILVKNNHIDAHGNLDKLLKDLNRNKPEGVEIEIEVRNMDELKKAVEHMPKYIMLDNMDDAQVKEAVAFIRAASSGILIEVSGGIKEERLAQLSKLGIDFVSMGMLTNSARSMDISLKLSNLV
jgi:nicotinate-nucleotide pyrophosphorylase (carboxylating)